MWFMGTSREYVVAPDLVSPAFLLTLGQPNILIDGLGHALITDFGLTKVTQSLDSIRSASRHGNTPRWSAPEVLIEGLHSKEADMFSFAMVIIEVRHGWRIVCWVLTRCYLSSI